MVCKLFNATKPGNIVPDELRGPVKGSEFSLGLVAINAW